MAFPAQASPGGTPADRPAGLRRSTRYVPELESLRGIAILLVFLYHADGIVCRTEGAGGLQASPLTAFARAGHTGVSLFFVLSAFLLSLPFLAEARGEKRVSRPDYFLRRALRILPLYYFAVLVGSVLSASSAADLLRGAPYLLFLNSASGLTTPLNPYSVVWWSLATEMQFYLLLPLVPLLLRTRGARFVAGVVCAALAAAYVGFLTGRIHMRTIEGEIYLARSFFGQAPLFVSGGCAAWIYLRYGKTIKQRLSESPWCRNGGADLGLLVVLGLLGLLLQWASFQGYWRVSVPPRFAWHVAEAVLWGAVLLLVVLAPLRSRVLFSNRILGRIGVLSYSIYLVHYPVLRFCVRSLQSTYPSLFIGWTWPAIALVATLAAVCGFTSALTYRVIERPFLVRKARIDR